MHVETDVGVEIPHERSPFERPEPRIALRIHGTGHLIHLFAGPLTGGRAAAIACTLIETAKLDGVDPQAWRAETLARIPD